MSLDATAWTDGAVLAEGYRKMAADRNQEAEAEEWAEALIGDFDAGMVDRESVSVVHASGE